MNAARVAHFLVDLLVKVAFITFFHNIFAVLRLELHV